MKVEITNQALACKYLTELLQDYDAMAAGQFVATIENIQWGQRVIDALLDYILYIHRPLRDN